MQIFLCITSWPGKRCYTMYKNFVYKMKRVVGRGGSPLSLRDMKNVIGRFSDLLDMHSKFHKQRSRTGTCEELWGRPKTCSLSAVLSWKTTGLQVRKTSELILIISKFQIVILSNCLKFDCCSNMPRLLYQVQNFIHMQDKINVNLFLSKYKLGDLHKFRYTYWKFSYLTETR